MAPVLLTTSPS
jgi:hypothetical protein